MFPTVDVRLFGGARGLLASTQFVSTFYNIYAEDLNLQASRRVLCSLYHDNYTRLGIERRTMLNAGLCEDKEHGDAAAQWSVEYDKFVKKVPARQTLQKVWDTFFDLAIKGQWLAEQQRAFSPRSHRLRDSYHFADEIVIVHWRDCYHVS